MRRTPETPRSDLRAGVRTALKKIHAHGETAPQVAEGAEVGDPCLSPKVGPLSGAGPLGGAGRPFYVLLCFAAILVCIL